MRTLRRNKQKLKYALLINRQDVYATDDEGNIIYTDVEGVQVPVVVGQNDLVYSQPVEFEGNISVNDGETRPVEYGIDVSDYDATLVVEKGSTDLIEETTLIWHTSEVGYKDEEHTIIDEYSADYRVRKNKPSLNEQKYLLSKVVKQNANV